MTKLRWPPENCDPLLLEMGRIVLNFNQLEGSLDSILRVISSSDEFHVEHEILTMHMGNVAKRDAMCTIANELREVGKMPAEIHDLTLHCAETFDRTREYRNWYVHGFNGVTTDGNGHLFMRAARTFIKDSFQWITAEDARWFADWCAEAHHHVATSYCYIAQEMGVQIGGPTRTLPHKWSLPDKLRKPQTRRRYTPAQPPTSHP